MQERTTLYPLVCTGKYSMSNVCRESMKEKALRVPVQQFLLLSCIDLFCLKNVLDCRF